MTTPSPLAFSPGSVTCFFAPHLAPSPEQTYSRGCAINLSHGVTAALEPTSGHRIVLNGAAAEIAPVLHVLDVLAPEPVLVSLETPLPLGFGFGVSAASCLAVAFSLNGQYRLGLSRLELGRIAHAAEVRYRTGLGDVASQLCGGVVHRHCRRGPLDAERLTVRSEPLYYRAYRDLSTPAVLNDPDLMREITEQGERAMTWLEGRLGDLTPAALLARSLEFAEAAHLVTHPAVIEAISQVRAARGQATMALLGQSVISTVPVGAAAGGGWVEVSVDQEGTRYLG